MSDQMISYRGAAYSPDAFEREFNPRAIMADMEGALDRRRRLAAATRTGLRYNGGIAYGASARQTIDIFPPDPSAARGSADLLFFHGGYWRAGHGLENCFIAESFTAAGGSVAMASYDLCPQVGIGDIVGQAKEALAWTVANAADHGIDPTNLWIGGHSAGAHLCAMLLADPETPPVAGALLVSGIFDIAPVLNITINEEIQATEADVAPWSPLSHPPARPTKIVLAVGGEESTEWQRQSILYGELARDAGCKIAAVTEAGEDHLGILFNLRRLQSPTVAKTLSLMGT